MGDMRYRRLGDSGLAVSVVGLGCNQFARSIGPDETRAVVDAALDAGITLFDTADTYGRPRGASEELLGRALGNRRGEVIVATKFGHDMVGANGPDWDARGSRRYIRRAVEASLRRLGTDWIDLYQLHKPDPMTPIEETLAALTELVREGKVRYIGSSQFAGWQVIEADWTARTAHLERFVGAQNYYNLVDREAELELVPACLRAGVGVIPFFPLARGLLTGKYRRGQPPPPDSRLAREPEQLTDATFDVVEALERYADERGSSVLDLAIGGLAAQPGVASVIAGATKPEQVRANAAAGLWEPTADDLAALDAVAPTPRKES